MSRAEILKYCIPHGGDMNRAARAYAKEHGLPARDVLMGWKIILAPTTRAKGAKE